MFNTHFLPTLILVSSLVVSCVFAEENKTTDFATGWVCLWFLHTLFPKVVFEMAVGETRDTYGQSVNTAPGNTRQKVTPVLVLLITSRTKS